MDIKAAFDTIKQDRMMNIISTFLDKVKQLRCESVVGTADLSGP